MENASLFKHKDCSQHYYDMEKSSMLKGQGSQLRKVLPNQRGRDAARPRKS
jgi:hypothetical protein